MKRDLNVGDWVISTSWINPEPRKIIRIELATTPDEEDFVFFREDCCVEMEYIEKWHPKEDEWVIPDTGIDEDIFVVMKYNGISLIPERPRPFIGELPYES